MAKTQLLSRLTLIGNTVNALRAVFKGFEPPKEDRASVLLKMEMNRRDIPNCILNAIGGKSETDYTIQQLLMDMDRYYYAGFEHTANANTAMSTLRCQ